MQGESQASTLGVIFAIVDAGSIYISEIYASDATCFEGLTSHKELICTVFEINHIFIPFASRSIPDRMFINRATELILQNPPLGPSQS